METLTTNGLTLYELTPQNGQTHSSNSSADLTVFDHFVGFVLKGYIFRYIGTAHTESKQAKYSR